jgi:hypothetical protein
MPVTAHWAVICRQVNEDGLATSTGQTHPLPPSAAPKAGIGFPTGAHPKRGGLDGHEPELVGLAELKPSALRFLRVSPL